MSSTSRSRTRAGWASRSGASRIRFTGGLGLNLVNALSLHWGIAGNGDTLVWADLPLSEVPPRAPRSARRRGRP